MRPTRCGIDLDDLLGALIVCLSIVAAYGLILLAGAR